MAVKNQGARIYNIFPRLVGNMEGWVTHFERAKQMGFNWLYINPFHYPGFSGSLYAPKDYYDFNPIFVDSSSKIPPMKQLENMIKTAHKMGFMVIMDLVINHTAKDHPFIKIHPDWYIRDDDGEIKSPGAWNDGEYVEWGDLAEIDNTNSPDKEKLWKYWQELVLFYLNKGFDGFRADAAYAVPTELWEYLIGTAKKKNKDAKFFAESLGCSPDETLALAKSGFDYIFNSSKWWDFQDEWLLKQYNHTREITPSVSFPESHDTIRLSTELQNYIPGIKQKTLFSAFFATGWMIPIGFEFGFKNKTDVVQTFPEDWEETNYNIVNFITDINKIKAEYQIFNEETPIEVINNDNWANIIVLRKTGLNGKEKALIVINKDFHNGQNIIYGKFHEAMGVPNGTEIIDLSIENKMSDVPTEHFEYYLQPAEFKLFYAKIK